MAGLNMNQNLLGEGWGNGLTYDPNGQLLSEGISGGMGQLPMSGFAGLNPLPAYVSSDLLPQNKNGFFDSWNQQKNADGSTFGGYGSALTGLAQAGVNAFMGMKQYGLAKDTLKNQKEQFNKQYAAQRDLTNDQLAARDNARNAANPTAYANLPKTRIA